jgi:FkbM family methyltransferase
MRSIVNRLCDHTFLPDLLSSDSIVLDLGANHGDFSHGLINRFGCYVYAAEPLSKLRKKIKVSARLNILPVAIGGKNGTAGLHVFRTRCASLLNALEEDINGGEEEVEVVDLKSFLALTGVQRIDLMKVDIEGSELGMFEAASDDELMRAAQITVEFHDFIYPELYDRVMGIIRRIESLGFWRINFSLDNTDVLFINRAATGISGLRYRRLKYLTKYLEGGKRKLRKWRS